MKTWLGIISFSSQQPIRVSTQQNIVRSFVSSKLPLQGYEFQSNNKLLVSFHLEAQQKLAADAQLADLVDQLVKQLDFEHLQHHLHVESFTTQELSPQPVESHIFLVAFKDKRSIVVAAHDYSHWSLYYRFVDADGNKVAEFRTDDVEAIVRADRLSGPPLIPSSDSSHD